jgi:hypothetical protein
MVSETASRTVDLADLSPGQLLTRLQPTVTALTGKPSHYGMGGGIPTTDNAANPESLDDVGAYQTGVDNRRQINIAATLKNNRMMANKGRGDEVPRKYHAIVEHSDRYLNISGRKSLQTLSRLGLASLSLAAQQEYSSMRVVIATDEDEPQVIDHEEFSAVGMMIDYDKRIKSMDPDPKPKGTALAQGLRRLMHDSDNFESKSDVLLVASDFLGGEQRRKGELVGFDWAKSLSWLNSQLGDRLLVMRLTTPGQRFWPEARTVEIDGRPQTFDTADQLEAAGNYYGDAIKKDHLIRKIIGPTRHIELDSADKLPQVKVPEFMFQLPAKQ